VNEIVDKVLLLYESGLRKIKLYFSWRAFLKCLNAAIVISWFKFSNSIVILLFHIFYPILTNKEIIIFIFKLIWWNLEITDYKGVDILKNVTLREGVKKYSNWPTYPQLYVDGKLIGGCDIVNEMHKEGTLRDVFV